MKYGKYVQKRQKKNKKSGVLSTKKTEERP